MKKKLFFNHKSPAQAMVEFALILPILLLVIYGLIETGRLLFIYSSVTTSARSAARYGATTGMNDAGTAQRFKDCDGMRAAAKRSSFMAQLEDDNIVLSHDKGEGVSEVSYCPSGTAVDTSTFEPSAGNTDRIKVIVTANYAPILPILPFDPFEITSTSARTILVSVPVAITAAPGTWDGQASNTPPATNTQPPTNTNTPPPSSTPSRTPTITQTPTISRTPTISQTPTRTGSPTNTGTATRTGTPTNTSTATYTPSPVPTTFTCVMKHSALKTSPTFSMTIFNQNALADITISKIEIYANFSQPGNQELTGLSLGGSIWSGSITASPAIITTFTGSVTVAHNSSALLSLTFFKNYNVNGTERILVYFVESSCPTLDSNDPSTQY